MEQRINFRPGLVLNKRVQNYFGKTIQIGFGHYYSHTFWITAVVGEKVLVQEAQGIYAKKVVSHWVEKSYLDDLFKRNELAVLNFNIINNDNFTLFCSRVEGLKYDYFAIGELFLSRLCVIFGINPEKFLTSSLFKSIFRFIKKDYTSVKRVDCSEMIARGIAELKDLPVLEILGKSKYEHITPQDISTLHMKLQTMDKL